jgi:hypothetical protein
MGKIRNVKVESIYFLFSNKNINLILFILLKGIGLFVIFNSCNGNLIIVTLGKNIANT